MKIKDMEISEIKARLKRALRFNGKVKGLKCLAYEDALKARARKQAKKEK